jgi:tetratricopeptide (TPR) repeat protein
VSLGPEWLRASVKIWARRGDLTTARRVVSVMARNEGVSTAGSSVARNTATDRSYIDYSEGEIALAQGHAARAAEIIESAHLKIDRAETLEALAAALGASGQIDEAAKRYEELLARKPLGNEAQEDWLHAHVALARIREKQGRTADARALCDQLLAIWKDAEPDTALAAEARTLRDRL